MYTSNESLIQRSYTTMARAKAVGYVRKHKPSTSSTGRRTDAQPSMAGHLRTSTTGLMRQLKTGKLTLVSSNDRIQCSLLLELKKAEFISLKEANGYQYAKLLTPLQRDYRDV